jgi:Transposase DDE domain group 1
LKVMGRSSIQKVEVRADGTGLSSRAGAALLPLAAERLGLTDALGWALGETRERRSAHDPGRVFCDLAVMLADGGRCVSDLVALGSQPALFGDVASISTARRVLLSVGEAELDRLRAARAQARARAWAAGAAPDEVILDFDATPITAHSDKEGAAGHYKGGFGFNPLLVSCGREVLAAILRPGNAGANNAGDHLEVFEAALEQLPPAALDGPILARSDSAGASHALADACRETGVRFSFGYAMDSRVREAILALPEAAWRPAVNGDNQPREGAWVAELTDHVSLDAWPQGLAADRAPRAPASRRPAVVHRRRRAPLPVPYHRSARQRSDRPGGPPPRPRDRRRSRPRPQEHGPSEPAVLGLRAQPGVIGAALVAHDLTVWTQLLLFDAEHAVCEPKRLRYRLLHVAGRLTRHARRLTLHLPADWPWAAAIAKAFKRLAALAA